MHLTPDQVIFFQYGAIKLNLTIVTTWIIMAILVAISIQATRGLKPGRNPGRWQNFLESILSYTRAQLRDLGVDKPERCLPLVATLFLFISASTLSGLIPMVEPPIGSLSTTAALAVCVLLSVPIYGVASRGVGGYLHRYIEPTWVMLPFNITGEISRTVALAVRLFGNSMSAAMVVAICLSVAPLFFPIILRLLGLLTGLVQSYIFAVLAALYIAAGTRSQR